MTSTITAEERAIGAVTDVLDLIFHDGAPRSEMEALIAAAIRGAEEAAYERASAAASRHADALLETGHRTGSMHVRSLVKGLLSLKSPSPPKDQGHE